MEQKEKEWMELKEIKRTSERGGVLYIQNKNEFEQLARLLLEIHQNVKEGFFNDRLLVISSTNSPITNSKGEEFNKWQISYRPLGKNQEYAFLTTDEKGQLMNLIDLPLTDEIGTSEKLLDLTEKGEIKLTEYEKKYLEESHQEVDYSPNKQSKEIRL